MTTKGDHKSTASELADWLDRNKYHVAATELRRLKEELRRRDKALEKMGAGSYFAVLADIQFVNQQIHDALNHKVKEPSDV